MKSYHEHLSTLLSKNPSHVCQQASAIFPIFFSPNISMKLIFLNYWKLKRNIDHLLCRVRLRDLHGHLIYKKCFYVDEVKCYEIDLFQYLAVPYPFAGSLEIQFNSPDNLVFPYPAVAVVYKNQHFSTFVHAAQRVLNSESEDKNLKPSKIVESGFNIYAYDQKFSFITFINGPKALKQKKIKLIAFNQSQQKIEKSFLISSKPYQTHYLKLSDWKELTPHLNQMPGCLKMEIFNANTFPRFIVGNYSQKEKTLSVTHTYYDLSKSKDKSDYWTLPDKSWYPLTLMVPLKENLSTFTNVYFYPIYSPSTFWIDVEIYDALGTCLKKVSKFLKISSSHSFQKLNVSSLLKDLQPHGPLTLRMITDFDKKSLIPTRIKVGLDMGFKDQGLPCNICTNFYPANPSLEKKPSAFRWAPFMPYKEKGSIWCLNDAPKKNYEQQAKIEYTFYRPQDTKTLSFKKTLNPHGSFVIEHTDQTKEFFKDKIGWCVIKSHNPYLSTYYFSEVANKAVGGDHGF